MEIRVLRYFLTVAQIGNITKAANSMHLSQPTLSRQLADLERELGLQLFIRNSKSVSLTQEGMILKKRAEEILSLIDKTENEFLSIKNEVAGDIYIGAGETKAIKQIANVMRKLNKDYPKIKFHIVSGDGEDLSEKLDKGILDFCLFIEPHSCDKYDSIKLNEKDIWGILLRKDDPLTKKKSVKIEDIIDLPLLISRAVVKKTSENNAILDWFGENVDKLNIVGTYNLIYNAAIMTEDKIGYALGLDRLIADTIDSPLTFRPLEPKLEVGISIAWKKNQVFSKSAKLFLEELKNKFS